jgi:phosphoribosylaminoimidazolecarboxamide formyltransferase/IMP cyclohydrolase
VASERPPPVTVERALLSVDDKSGLVDLARGLSEHHIELWATGGTLRSLEEAGLSARAAEELTGIGAWFGGRVKTLHPALLGGILAPRTPEGLAELRERSLRTIDLVVVNFYPFARRWAEQPDGEHLEEAIDIGGVTLARAAAKNHRFVAVASDPADYPLLLEELRLHEGAVSETARRTLAVAAFHRTAAYDALIARGLGGAAAPGSFPETVQFAREPIQLRYGENPHQKAAVYRAAGPAGVPMVPAELAQLKGEPLSFTNLLDLDTALAIVAEYPTPTAAVVKHATPCGVASGATIGEALASAIATDPIARYGCVIAINRPFEAADAAALHGIFVDLLAAPSFGPGATEAVVGRAKLKLVRVEPPPADVPRWEAHSALGRLLLQQADQRQLTKPEYRAVTTRTSSPTDLCALDFAWRTVRHAKSNAIVLARGSKTVGIGSGQPTRVKAVELAVGVAGERVRGSVMASDAFFPFADGIEVAGQAGVAAIIQPGGSVRDPEVIAAAEKWGIAMYFTGWRVFRH